MLTEWPEVYQLKKNVYRLQMWCRTGFNFELVNLTMPREHERNNIFAMEILCRSGTLEYLIIGNHQASIRPATILNAIYY